MPLFSYVFRDNKGPDKTFGRFILSFLPQIVKHFFHLFTHPAPHHPKSYLHRTTRTTIPPFTFSAPLHFPPFYILHHPLLRHPIPISTLSSLRKRGSLDNPTLIKNRVKSYLHPVSLALSHKNQNLSDTGRWRCGGPNPNTRPRLNCYSLQNTNYTRLSSYLSNNAHPSYAPIPNSYHDNSLP